MLAITPKTGAKLVIDEAQDYVRDRYVHSLITINNALILGMSTYNSYMLMRPSVEV